MAPSKTWNIPALYCAFAIIPDPRCAGATATPCAASCRILNVLGMVAAEAAFATAMPGDGRCWITCAATASVCWRCVGAMPA